MFIPHTRYDRETMLKEIGVAKLEDLFQDIPAAFRFPQLELPPPSSEMEILAEMQEYAGINDTTQNLIYFLGAGVYNHYSPAVVDSIIRRGEFLTAYTPYQPEISQGTLQAIFEYQSLIASLTEMDVCNASHYDGATAVAEAVNMAEAVFRGKRNKIIISPAVHPHYRKTVRTYHPGDTLQFLGDGDITTYNPWEEKTDRILEQLDEKTALVVVQYPDFFGRLIDYSELAASVHSVGALLAIAIYPIALGLFKTPGAMGADIVTGEGQPLGIPMSYGGPYLGLFATRKEYVRKMAGRLVGETVDNRGQRSYVLTLTAREQHIRREKATSNICSNEGLMALASVVYLSALGKHGFRRVSELNYHKAHYAADIISKIPGYQSYGRTSFFNEFCIRCPKPVSEINEILLEHGILGGYDLGKDYPALKNHMLLAVTEMNTREEIEFLAEVLSEAVENGNNHQIDMNKEAQYVH